MTVEDRRPRLSVLTAIVVFLAVRITLLIVREPFFDELFTVWLARQPFSQIIPSLLNDSGPPLYYFLARFDDVMLLRCMSLVFACVQFVLIARVSWIAALLLAAYPPAALFAVDARAYALCSLLITIGVLAKNPYHQAMAFAAAAYTHYYGVLFFPLPLAGEGAAARRVRAVALSEILFLPGFYMAFKQPSADAMAWVREPLYAPLLTLSWAGRYPAALLAPSPWVLVVTALVLLIVAARTNPRGAIVVGIPLALAIAFQLAGRPVYFPMRFESVLAGPLVLALANSRPRFALPLAAIGIYALVFGAIDHYRRLPSAYREAAMVLAQNAKPGDVVVASGYLYLEAAVALDRPIVAWPRDQALHPGWRSTTPADPSELPQTPFLWIGERGAPELVRLQGVRAVNPLFHNERAMVTLTRPLH